MKEKMSVKDCLHLAVLCITLFGGVYAYAESQVQIKENKEDVEEVKEDVKGIKKEQHNLKTQDALKTQAYQSMSEDIKEIRDILKENFKNN